MKEIKVFANVNPLDLSTLIPVWTSRTCGSFNENDWWIVAREHKKALESLGYRAEIHEIITTIYK